MSEHRNEPVGDPARRLAVAAVDAIDRMIQARVDLHTYGTHVGSGDTSAIRAATDLYGKNRLAAIDALEAVARHGGDARALDEHCLRERI